jgi:hypothetical protein
MIDTYSYLNKRPQEHTALNVPLAFNRDLMTSFHENAQFTVRQTGKWQTVYNYYRLLYFLNAFVMLRRGAQSMCIDKNDRIRSLQVLFSVFMFMLSLSLLAASTRIRLTYLLCSLTCTGISR